MRVLLADGQTQVRSALQILLKQQPGVSVVGEVSEAHSLLAQLDATRPDLLLLDWSLPGLATVGSVAALRQLYPHVTVIVLSGRPEACREATAAGAHAFVSKADPPEQLLAALHALGRKKSPAVNTKKKHE